MGLKTSGDTMQSPNNSSRRCAHVSVIFSPPGFALPMVGAGKEAIVFRARYGMQRGAKAGHTVGIRRIYNSSTPGASPGRSAGSGIQGSPSFLGCHMRAFWLPDYRSRMSDTVDGHAETGPSDRQRSA